MVFAVLSEVQCWSSSCMAPYAVDQPGHETWPTFHVTNYGVRSPSSTSLRESRPCSRRPRRQGVSEVKAREDLELDIYGGIWLQASKLARSTGLKKRPWWLLLPRFEDRHNSLEHASFSSKTSTYMAKDMIRRNVEAHGWLDGEKCRY